MGIANRRYSHLSLNNKTISGLALTCFLFVLLFTSHAEADEPDSATAVIEGFQATLLSVMRDAGDLGYQGRYQRLASEVRSTHDLHSIARIVTGRYWRRLIAEQKMQFVDTFAELSIATYAHKFDGYSGEVFEIFSESDMKKDDKLVRTVLRKIDGEEVRFDYQMRKKENKWMILNIIADGVSDLALKRSEYTGILRREGFDALMRKLREKISLYSHSEQ
jgi:phospholipid transport system substrate-binding protein